MEVISWEGNSCAVRLAVRLACWGREEGARSVGQTRRLASRQRARHGRRYAATVCSAAGGRGAQSTRALLVCPPAIHVCPAPAIHVCPPAQSRTGGDQRSGRGRGGGGCGGGCGWGCGGGCGWGCGRVCGWGCGRVCGRVCVGSLEGGQMLEGAVDQTQTDGRRRRDSTSQSPHEIH